MSVITLVILFSPVLAKYAIAITHTYSGPFTNTTYDTHGRVVVDLNVATNGALSGHINFTHSPGEPVLCGAGNISGSKRGNAVTFRFTSRDPDPGCGFDYGLQFTVTGTLAKDGRSVEGTYSINNGQVGRFNLTKAECIEMEDAPKLKRIHCWVTGQQIVDRAHGIGGLFTEPKSLSIQPNLPRKNRTDFSLGQLALTSNWLGPKLVEYGWIVAPRVFNDDYPHLFIALRRGLLLCFIKVGNIPAPTPHCPANIYLQLGNKKPGDRVGTTGRPMLYHVGYYGQNACGGEKGWWIRYENEWIDCVKESFWPQGFANGDLIEWFGEVAYTTNSCIPMGNGTFGSKAGSASISKIFYETMKNNKSLGVDARAVVTGSNVNYWNTNVVTGAAVNSFHYGGAGKCR